MTIPRVVFPAAADGVAAAAAAAADGVFLAAPLLSPIGAFPRGLICFLSFSAFSFCRLFLLLSAVAAVVYVVVDDDDDDDHHAAVLVVDVLLSETTNSG